MLCSSCCWPAAGQRAQEHSHRSCRRPATNPSSHAAIGSNHADSWSQHDCPSKPCAAPLSLERAVAEAGPLRQHQEHG
eukprot:3441090-Alexandrium_andersonii.AAC.1